jgi:hypothetical protein
MKCSDARFALAAEPSRADSALSEHLDACESCAAYARDMQELDRRLRDAMRVPAPDIALPAGPYVAASGRPHGHDARRLALAASVAGVALLVGMLWLGVPRQSLASAVVAHMAEEPSAWTRTESVPTASVTEVLAGSGVTLRPGLSGISYAHRCWFRGRHVPHLVVQTAGGPVTVMVLPREHVAERVPFDESGYRGVLVPAQRGSIAVLARNDADVDVVAARARAALAYLD